MHTIKVVTAPQLLGLLCSNCRANPKGCWIGDITGTDHTWPVKSKHQDLERMNKADEKKKHVEQSAWCTIVENIIGVIIFRKNRLFIRHKLFSRMFFLYLRICRIACTVIAGLLLSIHFHIKKASPDFALSSVVASYFRQITCNASFSTTQIQ